MFSILFCVTPERYRFAGFCGGVSFPLSFPNPLTFRPCSTTWRRVTTWSILTSLHSTRLENLIKWKAISTWLNCKVVDIMQWPRGRPCVHFAPRGRTRLQPCSPKLATVVNVNSSWCHDRGRLFFKCGVLKWCKCLSLYNKIWFKQKLWYLFYSLSVHIINRNRPWEQTYMVINKPKNFR